MTKPPRTFLIKSWYTIPDAARRLTQTLEEQITDSDVYQLCYEGRLRLSWQTSNLSATSIWPQPRCDRRLPDHLDSLGWTIDCEFVSELTGIVDFHPDSRGISSWLLSLATGHSSYNRSISASPGCIVVDDDGDTWIALERSRNVHADPDHVCNYIRLTEAPSPAELVIREQSLLGFEASLLRRPTPAPRRTSDETRSRRTRAIIAAAIARLGKVDLTKTGVAQRIKEQAEALGTPVDDTIIRQYIDEIKEALDARRT